MSRRERKERRGFLILFILLGLQLTLHAQDFEKLTTVALQVKPIFRGGLLHTGEATITEKNVDFTTVLASGISGGMLVRKGLTKLLAMEIGINYTRRNYTLDITDHDTTFSRQSEFRITAYEIPVTALAYVRLGEQLYVNASLGYCLNFFPSDILTYDKTYYEQYAVYNTHFRSAVQANLGTEWRTEKSGSFYIGAIYMRPFGEIYSQKVLYHGNPAKGNVYTYNGIAGDYLTLDLRYYFHAEPPKKKPKHTE